MDWVRRRFPALSTTSLSIPASFAATADAHPLSYLIGSGSKAYPVVALTWGLAAISVIVVVLICILLVAGADLAARQRSPMAGLGNRHLDSGVARLADLDCRRDGGNQLAGKKARAVY
jgi:hypothetical protein